MGYSAFGTLIKIGDGQATENFTTIAEVKDISGPGLSLDTTDITNHSSPGGWEEVLPTIKRSGEVTLDLNFVPENATQGYSSGLLKDFNNRTKRNFQIVFPNTGNTTWAFSAYVTGYEPSAPHDDRLSASVTLKPTGAMTLA